jgi:hypothetical protein
MAAVMASGRCQPCNLPKPVTVEPSSHPLTLAPSAELTSAGPAAKGPRRAAVTGASRGSVHGGRPVIDAGPLTCLVGIKDASQECDAWVLLALGECVEDVLLRLLLGLQVAQS